MTTLADHASAIVVIMQRLHERDVAGIILAGDMGYDHLNLPMEFEADRRCSTSIGFSDPRTEDGELLFPERFPVRTVEALKRDKGAYAWGSQYQQRPAPRDGGLFKPEWFDLVAHVPDGCSSVRAWDLAATVPTAGRTRRTRGRSGPGRERQTSGRGLEHGLPRRTVPLPVGRT